MLTIQKESTEEQLIYSLDSKSLEYYLFNNDEQVDRYTYDFNSNSCVIGTCDLEEIEKIENEYLVYIK